MKKSFIGAIVGGLIIFIWQFLSWALINFHKPVQQYTPNQDAIMSVLNSNLQEGGYFMPSVPETATEDEMKKAMKESIGKPWASIQYHKSMEDDMVMNIVRGLIVDIVAVWILCWILLKLNKLSFGTIFTATLFTGLIVFLNAPYTMHIWYKTFDVMAHFADALVSWGLTGLWLGWWLSRNGRSTELSQRSISNVEHLHP